MRKSDDGVVGRRKRKCVVSEMGMRSGSLMCRKKVSMF